MPSTNTNATHTLSPEEIAAFHLAIEEYSDAFGRTYDTPECDDAYNIGRTVAEMPGDKWWPLFRAAPDLLAALERIVTLNRETTTFSDNRDEIDRIASDTLSRARGA